MGYGHEEDVDSREYEMIYTLFYGAEEEKERLREAEGEEQPPCDCPPVGDGIAVRILKFIFGEKVLQEEYDKESERRPYHRHIQQPAHTQSNNRGSRRSASSRRSSRKRLPQYPMLAEDPVTPPPGGSFPDPTQKAETLLRLIASVLCAAAVIIFSTALTQFVKIKEWLSSR